VNSDGEVWQSLAKQWQSNGKATRRVARLWLGLAWQCAALQRHGLVLLSRGFAWQGEGAASQSTTKALQSYAQQ